MRKNTILILMLISLMLQSYIYIGRVACKVIVEVKPDRIYASKPVRMLIKVLANGKPLKGAKITLEAETGGLLINGTETITLTTNERGIAKATLYFSRCGVVNIYVEHPEIGRWEGYILVFFKRFKLTDYLTLIFDILLIFIPLAIFLYIGPIRARRRLREAE